MKQVSQSVRTGDTRVVEVPAPGVRADSVLVHVGASLVSAGTERMVVQFAEKSLLQKIRARPDLARQVIAKSRRDGILTSLEAVWARLDQPMPLGYSVGGTVLGAGAGAQFRAGDRVACAGANHAVHAEIVSVPKNFVVAIDERVSFDEACFATLGAVALQGIRLAEINLGETAAVIGLGLLGQMAVQMLRAAGVQVVGMDIDATRASLAHSSGAIDVATSADGFEAAVRAATHGRGVDATLICADTPSSQPLELAASVTRDKGVVVAVGAVGLDVPRKPFFEKELDLRISRSYGPGRYDVEYEERGHDYPYGYVRWTEQRNLDAVVRMMASGALDVRRLVTHRFSIDDAGKAYDVVTGKTNAPFLAVLLHYPEAPDLRRRLDLRAATPAAPAPVRLGVIGAGLFANATLLPAIKQTPGISLETVCAASGLSAEAAGRKFGFRSVTTDQAEVLADLAVNTVAILTRHQLHARQVIDALGASKHVFVEKPLCLTDDELDGVIAAWNEAGSSGSPPALMVGFNRRFAPFVVEIAGTLASVREPLMLCYRVNAGYIPKTHWTQDPAEGGRLVGEGCHFIDLLMHLSASPVRRVTTHALPDHGRYSSDNVVVTLEFVNGSIGVVTYMANGHQAAGKELLEVHGGGVAIRLDDYRTLTIHEGGATRRRHARLRQDKGHRAEWSAFSAFLNGQAPDPMPFAGIVAAMRATFGARRSLETGEMVPLD